MLVWLSVCLSSIRNLYQKLREGLEEGKEELEPELEFWPRTGPDIGCNLDSSIKNGTFRRRTAIHNDDDDDDVEPFNVNPKSILRRPDHAPHRSFSVLLLGSIQDPSRIPFVVPVFIIPRLNSIYDYI